MELKLHLGQPLPHPGEERRRPARQDGLGHAENDLAALEGGLLDEDAAELGDQRCHLFHQARAIGREHHAPPPALDERSVVLPLQRRHPLTHRGLGDFQHRGRFHHGAGFRQRYERFEIFNHSNYSQKETVAQCMLCGPPPVGRAA